MPRAASASRPASSPVVPVDERAPGPGGNRACRQRRRRESRSRSARRPAPSRSGERRRTRVPAGEPVRPCRDPATVSRRRPARPRGRQRHRGHSAARSGHQTRRCRCGVVAPVASSPTSTSCAVNGQSQQRPEQPLLRGPGPAGRAAGGPRRCRDQGCGGGLHRHRVGLHEHRPAELEQLAVDRAGPPEVARQGGRRSARSSPRGRCWRRPR